MTQGIWKVYAFDQPAAVLLRIFEAEPRLFFLESALTAVEAGRYSFLGFDPFDTINGEAGFEAAREKFSRYQCPLAAAPTPFPAGMAGCLSYDWSLHNERLRLQDRPPLEWPLMSWAFYDCVLTLDHWEKKLLVFSSGLPQKEGPAAERRAKERLEHIERKLSVFFDQGLLPKVKGGLPFRQRSSVTSSLTREKFTAAVRRALEYIREGDIYQVNLAQRFSAPLARAARPADALAVYQDLQRLSPANFGGYFEGPDFFVVSHSPERFLQAQGRFLETRPMKGTRPRGSDALRDQAVKEELLHNAKEKAELLMVTDLERNDLGRVCRFGSVKVADLRRLEEYAMVFQATARVTGELREGCDYFDALKTCFPSGSVTGCPKIRAMEIIDELEPVRRGLYTGALGYMSFAGTMDFNVLIRSVFFKDRAVSFYAGSGIVADSNPEAEYEETLLKARAIFMALGAENGDDGNGKK